VQLQLERMILSAMLVQKTDDQSEISLQRGKKIDVNFIRRYREDRTATCENQNPETFVLRRHFELVLVPTFCTAREITRKQYSTAHS
jgi:hypothetical protein